ncbi:MAG: metal-dependent hydrolase [Nitriliruptorales bacterium]|nr:metal-dependent hydrolase [Nitriliruptorales bacterium]
MSATAIPQREIKARRIGFEPERTTDKYFAAGDPIMSHVVATLSALFPEGEDFFVESVKAYRSRITDPELKRQVSGFIGQEALHSREHEAFNARLAELGFRTRGVDTFTRWLLGLVSATTPRSWQLAVTAALEHYTATLAEVLLGDPEARGKITDEEIRSLLLWHAFEESEHKAVAFDVYATAVGNERLRAAIMNLTTAIFLAVAIGWTTIGVVADGGTYRRPLRMLRGLARLPASPWLRRDVIRRIRDYNRHGFHPDDHDATALLEEWRPLLFGEAGQLADRIQSNRAAADA